MLIKTQAVTLSLTAERRSKNSRITRWKSYQAVDWGGRRGEAQVARTEGKNKPTLIQPDKGLKVLFTHHPFRGRLPGRGKTKMSFSCLIKVCENANN